MKYAIDIPNFGDFADPRLTAEVARDAEAAGWDAVWVWDHIQRDEGVPYADPWILLTAIALATTQIRLGPMVMPLPRRRPWLVAREAVTLDHLSGGRFTLGVGIGNPINEFTDFGEETDLRIRAAMLDEGLAVLEGLWTGDPSASKARTTSSTTSLSCPPRSSNPGSRSGSRRHGRSGRLSGGRPDGTASGRLPATPTATAPNSRLTTFEASAPRSPRTALQRESPPRRRSTSWSTALPRLTTRPRRRHGGGVRPGRGHVVDGTNQPYARLARGHARTDSQRSARP